MRGVETILFLVVLGTVVAAFAGRLRVPAPALLVIAGLIVGLLPGVPPVRVTPDLISLVVLPPLLYAASEELPWRDLWAVWRPVVVLAVGLVLASAAAVAAVAGAVAGIPGSMAFVLGAVLASTDPVVVSALGRRLSLPPKVQALVQAESLFNDATSLVLFQIAVSFAVAGTAGHATAGGVLLHGAGSSRSWRPVQRLLGRCQRPVQAQHRHADPGLGGHSLGHTKEGVPTCHSVDRSHLLSSQERRRRTYHNGLHPRLARANVA